jgi:hypothetical protein
MHFFFINSFPLTETCFIFFFKLKKIKMKKNRKKSIYVLCDDEKKMASKLIFTLMINKL